MTWTSATTLLTQDSRVAIVSPAPTRLPIAVFLACKSLSTDVYKTDSPSALVGKAVLPYHSKQQVHRMGLLLRAVPLLFALSYTNASPLQARQAPDANLTEYITQVKTALYVVNSLEANNQSTACSDAQLASTLDASGYDGEYAQQLL